MNNDDADGQTSNIQDKDSQADHQTRRYESLQLAHHTSTQVQACCSEAQIDAQLFENITPDPRYAVNKHQIAALETRANDSAETKPYGEVLNINLLEKE